MNEDDLEMKEIMEQLKVALIKSLERDLADAHPDDAILNDPDIRRHLEDYIKMLKGEPRKQEKKPWNIFKWFRRKK